MSDYSEIFRPFVSLFTQSQVNTILLAWLPSKLEPYMTGIITVDMFITSVIASGISILFSALFNFIVTGGIWKNKKSITIQIEYYTVGKYGYLETSEFYEALSWIISQQTKKLDRGSFVVQLTNSIDNNKDDEFAPPDFNVLPEKGQQIIIKHKGKEFHVAFNMPVHIPVERENNYDYYYCGSSSDSNYHDSSYYDSNGAKSKPSIYLTVKDSNTNVDSVAEFLNEIVQSHLETKKKIKVRSRYERNDSYWCHVQSLSSIRGLDSIALDESQEMLLKKELETFINGKDFYERTGISYRRGILLYGKPGTGKTSLINAISSHLSRDIYYLNLKNIKDDNELSATFSEIPSNQIIVLEDVDTQSKILHKRKGNPDSMVKSYNYKNGKSTDSSKVDKFSEFSLSTFLRCLDGHILSEGSIIIMTTNHVEHLDPACIRPGRMDVHLNLSYCTHYQIKKMYKSVAENPEIEFPQVILEKIPEKLLPPCEVMMTMVLYRNETDLIPQKIYELVSKYENMKSEEEEDAHYIEETFPLEKKEIRSEEVKVDNKKEEIDKKNSDIMCVEKDSSDCSTDVDKDDKIQYFKIVETFTIASEAA